MDLKDGGVTRLTEKERWLYPAAAPGGSRLAAVEFLPDNTSALVVFSLDRESGGGQTLKEFARFSPPPGSRPEDLSWSSDGKRLYLILRSDQGGALASFDIEPGDWTLLTEYHPGRWQDPREWGEYILYSSEAEGIRNIYALERNGGPLLRITSRFFSASRPAAGTGKLYFIDHTGIEGEALAVMPLVPSDWVFPEAGSPRFRVDYFKSILTGENNAFTFQEEVVPWEYSSVSYEPREHAVNIHSWGLLPEMLFYEPPEIQFGLSSQDILGTFGAYGYGSWNMNEETFGGGLSLVLHSFYPVLGLYLAVNNRDTGTRRWTEAGLAFGAEVPLDFSIGLKMRTLIPLFGNPMVRPC